MTTKTNEATPEIAETIVMNSADIRMGVLLEIEAARAQGRLQSLVDVGNLFAGEMKQKYGINEETHRLTDWVTGFQRVKKE